MYRIYGEEFELLSDPFPEANRITIRAKATGDSSVPILSLRTTIVQSRQGQALESFGHSRVAETQARVLFLQKRLA
jgi:hypothetical protein